MDVNDDSQVTPSGGGTTTEEPLPPTDPFVDPPPTAPSVETTPEPVAPTAPDAAGRGWKVFAIGALAGALVGGLVGGGVAAVIADANTGDDAATPAANQPNLPLLSETADIRDIVVAASPSVVAIRTQTVSLDALSRAIPNEGAGSGFIISADGLIVTNNHVIDGAREINVALADGRDLPGTVLGRDPSRDLAVLRVDADDLPALPLGSSDELVVGDQVVAIGNALGLGDTPTVTSGIVSAIGRSISVGQGQTLTDLIQTDTAINPGNSGGPLLNSRGEVIGINTAIAGGAENIGFAIAIDSVATQLNQLEAGEIPLRPFLGVETVTVTDVIARQLGLATDRGVLVMSVTPGSGAEVAGIVRGDVIVSVDGDRIDDSADLGEAIGALDPGAEVAIEIERGGRIITVDAVIGERAGSL